MSETEPQQLDYSALQIEQRRNLVKLLFHAQAVKSCADKSVFKFAHRVKYGLNIFISAYKKDVVPELYNMYKGGELEEEYEKQTGIIDELATVCASIKPEDYPIAIGLLMALNNGDLKIDANGAE